MRQRCFAAVFVFALLFTLAAAPFHEQAPQLQACAVALPRDVKVKIASESAVIVWDDKTRTQHFIRRATFSTSAGDFGFLVPTPSVPALAEVPDDAFLNLAKITQPKTVTQPKPSGGCAIGCSSAPMMNNKSAGSVAVLEEKSVAGYKAAVLKATDADKLAEWLRTNGYESRPALTRWLAPYVAKGYIITAFKIEKPEAKPAAAPAEVKSPAKKDEPKKQASESSGKSGAITSAAVRMSFAAEAPFFPYSEPDDSGPPSGNRLLRVFFIGPFKAIGKYVRASEDWTGKAVWANELGDANWNALQPLLNIPGYQLADKTWLTEFEDPAGERVRDDVVFSADPNTSPLSRPDRIIYASSSSSVLPTYLGCLTLLLFFYANRFVSRKRSTTQQPRA